MNSEAYGREINIPLRDVQLKGILNIPEDAEAMIIFAHGSGSSRLSPRNNFVAQVLQQKGFGTLLFDLLTAEEDRNYSNRFDIRLIADRLKEVTKWVKSDDRMGSMKLGFFGASTGSAAALIAAAENPDDITAVVSRGGRPDLAMEHLPKVQAPTLLIVGSLDTDVIRMNQDALSRLNEESKMLLVQEASHLFEEEGKLEEVARLAGKWFEAYLPGSVEL